MLMHWCFAIGGCELSRLNPKAGFESGDCAATVAQTVSLLYRRLAVDRASLDLNA